MQPYFIPYTGYFRLFAATDLFVIYDCVQFPRRGWVHRNRLLDFNGSVRWLTLPLEKAPRDVLIRDLQFRPNAAEILADRMRQFPLVARDPTTTGDILRALSDVEGSPLDYIERLLERTVTHCGIPWRVIRSSTLNISAHVRGQDRILEIVRRLGATRYVNSPGGRDLYHRTVFAEAGIELCFLSEFRGSRSSILTRLLQEDRDAIAEDIIRGAQEVQHP